MRDKHLTLGSLFSGSGGFELAGILAGIQPVFNAEVEPFAIRVTTKRLPGVKHYGDVSKLNGADLPPVDILTWGSPCQDLSIAGKRAGLDGERSGLYLQAVRIVREMLEATERERPKYCVFENVPGLFSSNGGNDFVTCLDMMQELGFLPDVNVLDAQHMGVAQRRKRVYITWLNVEHLLKKRTPISDSITLQLLTEILLLRLGGLLRAYGVDPKKSGVPEQKDIDDSLMRRIRLFSLQKEDRLLTLQTNLDAIQATFSKEPTSSDLSHGADQTERRMWMDTDMKFAALTAESPYMSIGVLLRSALEENYLPTSASTTSTPTRGTILRKICICLQALRNTLSVTHRLIESQDQGTMFLNCYDWASSILTKLEAYTSAGIKCCESDEVVEWNELLRLYKQGFSALSCEIERNLAARRRQEILPFPCSLSGYSAEGFEAWQSIARNPETGAGAAGGPVLCVNPQGSSSVDVSEDMTGTLVAQDHGHHPAVLAAGFCTEHSADSRSIGYEEETS
ncbi:MAG: DNA (cytosine-5-)-methyltransferase, partial [Victivallales bacterium]|nr:DNA (cytosine-5-)-methyltransferase [Victivallales bacterium]